MQTYFNTLLGGIDPLVFLALLTLAMLGSLARVAYRADNKRKRAPNTPVHFDKNFFWYDNYPKFIICLLSNAIGVISLDAAAGTTAAAILAFGVGFGTGQFSIYTQSKQNKVR